MRSWCVPQNFLYPQRGQPLLMPVDMREWLPEDDLVLVVLDAVATLDLGEFCRHYRPMGMGGRRSIRRRWSRCCCMATARASGPAG